MSEMRTLDLAASRRALSPAARRVTVRDVAPSTRDASSRWVDWDGISQQLGQPFDNTRIPFSKLESMRRDPMLAFGLMFCKVPLVRTQWSIKCNDAAQAAVIDRYLRRIYGRLVLSMTNDFDYGFSPIAKRFELEMPDVTYIDKENADNPEQPAWKKSVQAVVWRPFFPLKPGLSYPAWNDAGEFNGIYYPKPSSGFTTGSTPPDIPLDYALWSTNEKDSVFGDIYGYPRTGYAYRYWWSYWYRFALADRAFERFADPAILVYHPTAAIDEETGEEVDFKSIALQAGEDVRSGATVAIPNTLIMNIDESNTSQRAWEISTLKGDVDFDALNQAFEYLDVQKLRALMVPEQALIEGRGGTSSRNVASTFGEALFESLAVKQEEIDDQINRFVIPQFVELNFGADAPKAEKVTKGFDQQDLDTMRQVVQLIGQVDPDKLQADVREIMYQLGIPTISVKEVQDQLRKAEQIAQEELPPPSPGDQESAGVTQQGLYYTPREVIHLSQGREHRYPKARQYEDSEVLAAADELRQLFAKEFNDWYEELASVVEQHGEGLGLAVRSPHAHDLVSNWQLSFKRADALKKKVVSILSKVMRHGGDRELTEFGLDANNWNVDRPDVQDWMEHRGAQLVRHVTDTVKNELRRFISNELKQDKTPVDIATAIRSHFSQWPNWKADRLARTEVRDAYNMASLLGYKSAGVGFVQAFDGSGGLTGRTDPHCVERNGKVFAIEDAMREDEHPNGTLGWRPIVTLNFEVGVVPQTELPLEDAVSWWNAEEGKLYLAEGLGTDEQREIMLRLGDRLCRKEE